jgi:hypothetical protein
MDSPQELQSIDTPGLPEVYVDGHKVAGGSKEALSEVYDLINMANMAKIRKILEDKTSKGWVYSLRPTATIDPPGEGYQLNQLAQSVNITNDGPSQCLVGINDNDNPYPMAIREIWSVDFEAHRIDRIYWQGIGGNATLRIIIKG